MIDRVSPGHSRKMLVLANPTLTQALRSRSVGDRDAAWRALYDEHFAQVYRLICRFGVPFADVEDVAQRVFVVAYRRAQEIEDVRNVGAWLRAIVVRVVAEHRRWLRVRRVKDWLLRASLEAERPPQPTPERDAAARQAQRIVAGVLAQMSPKLRDVLVLLDLEQLELREVAETLGIPANTVRSRRRLAREQFQRISERPSVGGRRDG
jgi:RNA polymerase sigma-70 factor (ECF subfamily)